MDLFGTMPQEPWRPGMGAKLDCIIQLNCREVHTHVNYKTTRTWENFNNQGTKMTLLSYELWLISNNSRSFTNRSRSTFRSDRKNSRILSSGGKRSCLKYTLNACKLDWEENIFDFHVEPIAFKIKILINASSSARMRNSK